MNSCVWKSVYSATVWAILLVMTGKTTLSQTFTQQAHPESYQATIGVDYLSRVLERDYNYSINIWDFSGDFQTYVEIRNEFYKELTAIVYLFDLGLKRTFDNLESYIKEVAEQGIKDVAFFLVANKVIFSDLKRKMLIE